MPVTSVAVMLPQGERLFCQPDVDTHVINIHGLKNEPILTISRAEAAGLQTMLNAMYPDD